MKEKKKGRSSFHCNKSLCFEHFSHKTCPSTQQHNAAFCLPTHFPQIAKPINTTGPLRSARQKGEESQAQNNCFTDKLDNAGAFPKLEKLRETRQKHFQQLDPRADSSFLLTKEPTRTWTGDTEENLQLTRCLKKGKSCAPSHKLAFLADSSTHTYTRSKRKAFKI